MKKTTFYLLFTLTFLFIFTINTNAQKSVTKKHKVGVPKSIKKGNKLFEKQQFQSALDYYLIVYEPNKTEAILNYRIGVCYLYLNKPDTAIIYLKEAEKFDKNVHTDIYFMLGQAKHILCKFDEAIKYYKKDKEINKSEQDISIIEKLIFECKSGKKLISNPVYARINMLPINSDASDYGTVIINNSVLYYTSRKKIKYKNEKDYNDNFTYEDIYTSILTEGVWQESKTIGSPINTRLHDAVISYSDIDETMFIYRNRRGKGQIFASQKNKSKWKRPKKLKEPFNVGTDETSFCLVNNAKTAFFCSNRTGDNLGQKDIFYCTKNESGEWSTPINLGANINTKYDEKTVFATPDGNTLYFSSNGHNSMGGYDIFETSKDEKGNWTKPKNLGYPINTPYDNIFYHVYNDSVAFYTSKIENRAKTDIFIIEYTIEHVITEKPDTTQIVAIDTIQIVDTVAQVNEELIAQNKLKELKKQAVYEKTFTNVSFGNNTSTLKNTDNLDILVEYMLLYPETKIKINGYTSSEGQLANNQALSQKRAVVVQNYMISKGVKREHITTSGKGSANPIAYNVHQNGARYTQSRIYNRRADITITEQGEKPIYGQPIEVPSQYSTNKNAENTDIFTIFLFYSDNQNDERTSKTQNIYTEKISDNYYFYYVGEFKTIKEATQTYNNLILNYPEAFILKKN